MNESPHMTRVTFRVPRRALDRIEAVVDELGFATKSEYIRHVIMNGLERRRLDEP